MTYGKHELTQLSSAAPCRVGRRAAPCPPSSKMVGTARLHGRELVPIGHKTGLCPPYCCPSRRRGERTCALGSGSPRRRVADRHHERELVVGNIGGRCGERLGAMDERQRLLVERGGAGALREPAHHDAPVPVEPEREPDRAMLAIGSRRIALVALE